MALKTSEKGQALIIISLAAVVLFGFAALAIDGSMIFSDQRHAQNAADTSALAAALQIVHKEAWNTTVNTANARAASNGYNNDGSSNVVQVYLCNDPQATCTALPTNAKPEEYVQVKITSHIHTNFARVIGFSQVTNHVAAVAHAAPGYRESLFGGNALVALNKTGCPAMDFKGSSTTTITGSGVFVNSNCNTGSNQAFNASTGSGTFDTPCMNVVGGITIGTNTVLKTPGTSCANHTNDPVMQILEPSTAYKKPNPCGTTAATYDSIMLYPGNYTGAFPPGNQTMMSPGVYCIDAGNQGFTLTGGQTLTGNNVFIYMKSGNVSWSSGGIHLSAMTDINPELDGLLLYLASGNCSSVSITGNGTSSYSGTVLAPCSNVKLAGGSSTGNVLENQIIADTITLTGSNTLNINFNASKQWQPPVPPKIQINQ
jgi:hypothetical protein